MNTNIERDLGRIESKVEMQTEDIKTLKANIEKVQTDLNQIKELLAAKKAKTELSWAMVLGISTVATIFSQVFNIAKHWITT